MSINYQCRHCIWEKTSFSYEWSVYMVSRKEFGKSGATFKTNLIEQYKDNPTPKPVRFGKMIEASLI